VSIIDGIDGAVSIAYHLPGQVVRTLREPQVIDFIKERISMSGYYGGNPQLFKMPAAFRKQAGPLQDPTPMSGPYVMPDPGGRLEVGPHGKLYETMGAFEQDSLKKVLPFIAIGIAGIVAYNMFFRKR